MQRITIALDDELMDQLDAHMRRASTSNRSETLRDLVRRALLTLGGDHDGDCVGIVSYARDLTAHAADDCPTALLAAQHDRAMAMLAAPLDHRSHVEVIVLNGRSDDVRAEAERVFARRGVRHGALALVPVSRERQRHVHGDGLVHEHEHLTVREGF
mgnify:CR=1 FL=1